MVFNIALVFTSRNGNDFFRSRTPHQVFSKSFAWSRFSCLGCEVRNMQQETLCSHNEFNFLHFKRHNNCQKYFYHCRKSKKQILLYGTEMHLTTSRITGNTSINLASFVSVVECPSESELFVWSISCVRCPRSALRDVLHCSNSRSHVGVWKKIIIYHHHHQRHK